MAKMDTYLFGFRVASNSFATPRNGLKRGAHGGQVCGRSIPKQIKASFVKRPAGWQGNSRLRRSLGKTGASFAFLHRRGRNLRGHFAAGFLKIRAAMLGG